MKILDTEQKKKIQNRLNRIEGQVHGISIMLEEDRDCREILQQLMAVQAAMQGVTSIFLEQVVNDCLIQKDNEDSKQDAVRQLIEMINRR